jgi:type IV pilus assembly protein PilC
MNNFFSKILALLPKKQKRDAEILPQETETPNKGSFLKQFFMGISLKDRILFIKQLSILIRAGVPLFSSLTMIKDQSKSKSMVSVMNQVIRDVENGQYLATALGKFKKIFGELTINIIAIGEISGTLSNNLDHLAITLKKQQSLRRKIISASVYPLFIIVATIGITLMLTVFIFPKIVPVFKSVNYELPWSTKFLIFLNDVIKSHGWFIFIGFIVFVIAIILLLRNKKVHFQFDKVLIRIPLVNKLIQTYNTASICRTIGLLLNSGVTVVRAFEITSNTTTNLLYKQELTDIAEQLTKGEKISSHMNDKKKLFPLMVPQMLQVGESTGKMSETFLYLADIYEEEMDDLTKNLSTTVEPLLLIFMGLLVGFIAISIITPIYGITQHLTPK